MMHDILPSLLKWQAQGLSAAIATVVKTWGSSPRPAGSRMAIAASGEFAGSVSGGCVETAVIEEAMNVMKTGAPKLLQFGVADETAWSVGLTCGGKIEVFLEPFYDKKFFEPLRVNLAGKEPVVMATVIRGASTLPGRHLLVSRAGTIAGDLENTELISSIQQAAPAFLEREHTTVLTFGETEIFVESCFPPPKLIIVGAVHIAVPLAHIAKTLDFNVILVDPRGAFASAARFPHVDQLVRKWPEEALAEIGIDAGACIVILSHDPKLDDPAVKTALQHHPAYIGVLGSRKTHEKRFQRLLAEGVTEEQLRRVHAPIGLNIGAATPAEITVSIMAEIVAQRRRMRLVGSDS